MANVPTDLLRTLVAVVDMRSFTKAAQALGVTQPAVSAQIKRLQSLLGHDLLDKSAPGVSLTPTGEKVLSHARRLLAINDEIVDLGRSPAAAQTLRVGVPGSFVGRDLWQTLAAFRSRRPDLRFHIRSGGSEGLLRELRQGNLDLAVAMSEVKPCEDARRHWTEDLVWIRAQSTPLQPSAPVPLLTYSENCMFHRHAVGALERAGRSYTVVFTASHIDSLNCALAAGLGVMALARGLTTSFDLAASEDVSLPKPSDVICNVCVRDENDSAAVDELADALGDALQHLARTASSGRDIADAACIRAR